LRIENEEWHLPQLLHSKFFIRNSKFNLLSISTGLCRTSLISGYFINCLSSAAPGIDLALDTAGGGKMTTKITQRIGAAVLGLALLAPAGGAFAYTRHHHRRVVYSTYRRRHHYSETRGTVVGAAAGALIDHRQPLKGAVIGGVVGNVVQKYRNKH
jgi:hypothetical protein